MEEEASTEFAYSADGRKVTVGGFTRGLLADKQFLGTVLPRIPVLLDRDIQAKLHSLDSKRRLKLSNEQQSHRFT